ncbi:hypothetical protein FK531_12620 [Rhodococcus spelaei]|uniref:Uncharacterized protein n=1 Tax=Rhodococcus spelaei TaxID=2546320 RepID=A0A541B8M6_9NOCA|nr:hypothetical protein [Rhodococcus spelaei]TQF68653.1 hypothetical protein FK531_12620 [Rhodococcus spelaei]
MDLLTKTLDSLWQVVLVGLLLGAGLPALFAFGLRLLGSGTTATTEAGSATTTRSPLAVAGAVTCFAVVVIAIVTGILFIMSDFLGNTFGIELF